MDRLCSRNIKEVKVPRIEQMYAFIAEEGPDDEGVIGMNTRLGWMPLVGADMARVKSLRQMALQVAREAGKPVKLLRFTRREELEVLNKEGKRQ